MTALQYTVMDVQLLIANKGNRIEIETKGFIVFFDVLLIVVVIPFLRTVRLLNLLELN